ncbi:unnamed protein product [Ceratitis capitata]|uniref:(Mediterranean fruit fly) hypothetical protein n=1 Tax=Ceratitis capitata TaxID=7213 RepID=A0A811VCP9_CERCA|nr:unnamed protein product [Ceratitis capitata]
MPVNIMILYTYLCLLILNGCRAYLIDQSGEVVEAYGEATTMSPVTVEPITANLVETAAVDTIIKPYNILETKPLPHCPLSGRLTLAITTNKAKSMELGIWLRRLMAFCLLLLNSTTSP